MQDGQMDGSKNKQLSIRQISRSGNEKPEKF